MGQKVNPVGLRVGIIRGWASNWYRDKKEVPALIKEDYYIRKLISDYYYARNIEIAQIGIERVKIKEAQSPKDSKDVKDSNKEKVIITIIGRKIGSILGRAVQSKKPENTPAEATQEGQTPNQPKLSTTHKDFLVKKISDETNKFVSIRVLEANSRRFYLTAQLVAQQMGFMLEKRGSHRKVQKDAITKIMKEGQAQGCKTLISGRLNGQEIAREEGYSKGRVPLHTLRADVDYAVVHAKTPYGILGVKVWIYAGDIMPGKTREEGINAEYEEQARYKSSNSFNKPNQNRNNKPYNNEKQGNFDKNSSPKKESSIFDRNKKGDK